MKPIPVLLIDDHALFRAGLKSLISQIEGFTVVGEAATAKQALEAIQHAAPEMVITDISLGDENGLDLVKEIRTRHPDVRIIVLSMHSSEGLVARTLKLGASAYLIKDAAPEELSAAMNAISSGQVYLSPAVSAKVIKHFLHTGMGAADPLENLTARQAQILTLLASGKATKEIAHDLNVSEKTVAAHRAQIMERLDIHDIASLTRFAIRHKLVQA